MRRIALTAAGLVVACTFGLSHVATSGAKVPIGHTCSVTDRQFIDTAKTNMAAIGLWGQEYMSGDARAKEVESEASDAAKIIHGTSPTDPSLAQARTLLISMFGEYGKAMHAAQRHKDTSQHMYRTYSLASFARDVLEKAQPALAKRGCDVQPLL
jgi:hypothetical protein